MKNFIRQYIKSNNNEIEVSLGKIKNLISIGEGGNGLVYKGVLYNIPVAIKFLAEKGSSKLERFKAEFFNIQTLKEKIGIADYFDFDCVDIEGQKISIIIMRLYECSLKSFVSKKTITYEFIKKSFFSLLKTIDTYNKNGIIHRDIKPENILVDGNGNLVLSDFGIAYFDSERYELKAKTKNGDRLANYTFSAPEQFDKNVEPHITMDIYAFGQIIQWLVTEKTHKGTGRDPIYSFINEEKIYIYDQVIEKCLRNDAKERFQSIEEIFSYIEKIEENLREKDPFDDINLFNRIIRSSAPRAYNNFFISDNVSVLKRFINNLKNDASKLEIYFNTGMGNNQISNFESIIDDIFTLDGYELKFEKFYAYCGDSSYDDFVILKVKNTFPFIFEGIEYHSKAIINGGDYIIPGHFLDAGYVELNDEVYKNSDISIEYRNVSCNYRYIAICTYYNCMNQSSNDEYLENLQKLDDLSVDILMDLLHNTRKNKHSEVIYYL